MAMMPVRTKYRKTQKGQRAGLSKAANFLDYGDFGMQVLARGWVTARQMEACRIAVMRCFNRKGQFWMRIFPDKALTKKPAETRMGKGKGNVEQWVAVVRPGRILFEVGGISKEVAQDGLRRAAAKLGLRTRFVSRLERV